MSNFQVKPFVRTEVEVKKIGKLTLTNANGGKDAGALALVATGSLPSATNLPNGVLIIDSTTDEIKFTKNGSWVAA